MPRDTSFACKKRQHPDGLHLSSSLPKRLFSISEAEIGSSVEDAFISPRTAIETADGFFRNPASSALINSNCSTSIRPTHSSISLDAASSKPEGSRFVYSVLPSDAASSELEAPGFVLSRLPSDAGSYQLEGADRVHSFEPLNVASYGLEAFDSTSEYLNKGKGKGIWNYYSDFTKREGLDCEGELSEVTFEKQGRTLSSGKEPGGVSGSEKATHMISRRDVSSPNSKDGLWHKAAHGYRDCAPRGKQWESSSKLYGARPRRDYSFSSMACESASSCASGDSMRSMQAFSHIYPSVRDEYSTMPFHTHTTAEVLMEPRLQERCDCKDDDGIQRRPCSEAVLHTSLTHKVAIEEDTPSYVLSSGRMSLEEEAKLGRRAPTVDRDFEEYFASLCFQQREFS